MTEWIKGRDSNRRRTVRRAEDKVCPYHDIEYGISCPPVMENKSNIESITNKMVKKDDLVDIKDNIKSLFKEKAPRWVVVTMITTAVPIVIALMLWIGSRLDVISTVKANQDVMMKAFNIEVIPKDFDNKK